MARVVRLRTFKRVRSQLYRTARWQGNIQPWLELVMLDPRAPKKIIRRQVHRRLGKMFSKQLFGSGLIAKAIRGLLGL